MHDVVEEGTRLWEQVQGEGLFSLTASDLVWLVGAVCLILLALKVARKVWKALLIIVGIGLILVWLAGGGL